MPTMLNEAIRWEGHPVPATAATGTIDLRVGTVGSGKPLGLLVASQHGEEGPWGARAIHKLLESTPLDELRGTLRVVPVANPLAFEENSREAHIDLEDLNYLLPGDPNGRHTERLAHTLVRAALQDVDVAIDVHGGGSWCMNSFVYRFEGAHDLAEWIGGPFVRDGYERGEKSLTCYVRNRGAKTVWIEMGGAGSTEEFWSQRVANGIRRALGKTGVLTPAPLPEADAPLEIPEAQSLRTPMPGLYLPELREAAVGTIVDEGTRIGATIDAVTGAEIAVYTAPYPRTAVMLIRPRVAVVEAGEMIAVLGNAG